MEALLVILIIVAAIALLARISWRRISGKAPSCNCTSCGNCSQKPACPKADAQAEDGNSPRQAALIRPGKVHNLK